MGYFETARDRARHATHEWRLHRQMRRNSMPNPNPAQPAHEPVLQAGDPPDLYGAPVEPPPPTEPGRVTSGAAGQEVDDTGNAVVPGDVVGPAPEAVGEYTEDGYHVLTDAEAAKIREEQDDAQYKRMLKHGMDIANDTTDSGYAPAPAEVQGGSTGVVQVPVAYPLGVDPAVAEAEHEAHVADPVSEPAPVPAPVEAPAVPVEGEPHGDA